MSINPVWADKKLTEKQRAHMAFRYLDWLLTKNVPSGGFPLLYAILQRLNEENQFHCYPSIDYLAARIQRKPPTVWEMLPKLEKLGVIEIEWGSQGSGHPNRYQLPAAFLVFYFGPEKGRLPKLVVPKKPRQTGVSKPRQAGVSDPLENPGTPPKKPRFTDGKPRPALESHFLATDSHKKERGSAARASDASLQSVAGNGGKPADDAPLNQRASPEALIEPVEAQPQTPSRDNPEMGCPAANGADHSGFGRIRMEFERLAREYPRIADKAAALLAFNAAVGKRGVTRIVMEITTMMRERGADLPDLADALAAIIERDLAITTNQPAQEDER